MQFLTIPERLIGRECYARQLAGHWEFFHFGYALEPTSAAEGITVDLGNGTTLAFANFWPEVKAGTVEGCNGLRARGIRLCGVRLVLLDPQQHDAKNPFRQIRNGMRWFIRECVSPRLTPVPPLRHEWLTSDLVALAQGIHANAALDGIPALTDALLEAGCDDPLVVEHLRTCPDHAPSCWVVEMILGQVGSR